jgi:hypothetical protein
VVREVVAAAGLGVDVEKVESMARLVELGALLTPAVAVDGRVVVSGHVPKPDELKQLFGLV